MFQPQAPHLVIDGFLGSDGVEGLLSYVQEREALFQPTLVGFGKTGRVEPSTRVSARLAGRGHIPPMMIQRLEEHRPRLVEQLGLDAFTPDRTQMEIVAHGHGAFYREHIDTITSSDAPQGVRLLSCVYYFHRLPKAFTGGALRVYGIARIAERQHVDIEPERDRLVAFPSFAPHEVLPVVCGSDAFMDCRFAINCWFLRRR